MFENIMINDYIRGLMRIDPLTGINYATRFIASWIRVGGTLNKPGDLTNFEKWLKSLELSKDDIQYIKFLATNGKLELEEDAKKFLNDNT